jgi:hypothetical protein
VTTCPGCGSENSGRFCPDCGMPLAQLCPQCGATVDAEHKFCAACGTPVAAGQPDVGRPPGPVSIGDIGLVKGTLDASTHIGAQTNITGPVTLHVQVSQPLVEDVVRRGRQLLAAGAYRDATRVLKEAHHQAPSNPEIALLRALALLRGRNPDVLRHSVIRQAEACLQAAVQVGETRGPALVILGVIKHDHYVTNGMSEGQPTLREIAHDLRTIQFSPTDRQLLLHVKASARAKELLGIHW